MWGNALARKWGAAPKAVTLNDGKGQGNNIAVFPTYVQGICAQLDLWRSSKNYKNKKFADAISVWSGHNEVPSYISFVKKRVPGLTEATVMDDAFWKSDKGVAFLKAQAWHEAGKEYPAPSQDWLNAQGIVLGQKPLEAPKKATQAIVVSGASQVAAHTAGFSTASAVLLGAIVVVAVGLFLWWKHKSDNQKYINTELAKVTLQDVKVQE
jgi:hypothetical protein